jgi:hypothetical protein
MNLVKSLYHCKVKLKKLFGYGFLLGLMNMTTSTAQLAIKNGVSIPTRDTLRVLVVFAEVDFEATPCPGKLEQSFGGNWPKNAKGQTLPPSDAREYFDVQLKPGQKPKGFITDYYHQASFGQYLLLGDFFPYAVTIPCSDVKTGNGVQQVLDKIAKWPGLDSSKFTQHGLPLRAFDAWSMSRQGEPKLKKPDGKTDLLYIIWRNNRFLTNNNTLDYSGFGVSSGTGPAFLNSKGINNFASFNASSVSRAAYVITIAEHLHGIFGGNNWHSSGGRGVHTFPAVVATYGLTGQHLAAMQGCSGWDRWMMEWKNPKKKHLVSCLNEQGQEVNTEHYTLDSFPKGGTYVLRNFLTTGDAIRIKLPHIQWEKPGDAKNQYLWIENRRMNSRFDEWYYDDCADNRQGQFPAGTPGIYAYIQVGKDQKEGASEIYGGASENPNALASPFFPFTAEGNFDFYYDFDRVQEAHGYGCNWNNRNIPIDKNRSKPNPFTGNNDLFTLLDFNGDGKILSGDNIKTGLSEIIGDSLIHDFYGGGDWEDAFCSATGHTEISISTNPAPVPVYTLATDLEYKRFSLNKGQPNSFENRTIWLNGLHIDILDDNMNQTGDVKLSIRWDDYTLTEDVRWCGNIVLSPNDFDTTQNALVVGSGQTLLLDQATSVTWPFELNKDEKGNPLFAESTKLTVLPHAKIVVQSKASLIIEENSKLILQTGSSLKVEKGGKIILRKGGEIVQEAGSLFFVDKKAKIIKK